MRWVLAAMVLLALTRTVGGDPPPAGEKPKDPPAPIAKPLSPVEAADAALVATKAKDVPGLAALAAKEDPDPWLVTDELCARGAFDAADEFARAAGGGRLAAYAAAQRAQPTSPDVRKKVTAFQEALRTRAFPDALAATEGLPAEPGDVSSIRLAMGRGTALRALRRLDDSGKAYERSADAAERLGWLEYADLALHESGASAANRSDYPEALRRWNRRLRSAEARGEKADAGATLGNIGGIQRRVGDYDAALSSLDRSLALLREAGHRSGTARTLVALGALHSTMGEHAKALSAFGRALEIMRDLRDSLGTATSLSGLAVVHEDLGDFPRALALNEEAYAILDGLGEEGRIAAVLGNMGLLHMRLGNYGKALECQERALAIKEKHENRDGAAMTLGALGLLHVRLGRFAEAVEYQERSLKISEDIGDHPGVARTLGNLGNAQTANGDLGAAMATLERALKARERLEDRIGMARTLGNLGSLHQRMGNDAKAVSYQRQALELFEALRDRTGIANTLDTLAYLVGKTKDYETALAYSNRALAAAEELGAPDILASCLETLARIRFAQNEHLAAVDAARRSMRARALLARGLGDEQAASARRELGDAAEIGACAATVSADVPAASFFLESDRAGALLEGLRMRETLWATLLPAELRTVEGETRAAETAAIARLRKALDRGERGEIAARRRDLDVARERLAAVVARIQREAKASAAFVYPEADSLETVAARLHEGEVFVTYGLFHEQAIALVVSKAVARIVTLGPAQPIRDGCKALTAPRPDAGSGSAAENLRRKIVDPLRIGAEVRRVLVSPHEELSYVPFALVFPGKEIAYLPSATAHGVLLADGSKRGDGVLALGDPDYGSRADPAAGETSRSAFGRPRRLPASGEEANAVGTTTLLGKNATESALRAALATKPRWHAVHLACHGLIDAERPSFSALALTAQGEDDGYLTCLDVFRMKVPADLVVLSACETGTGTLASSEGIVGLTRAFMFAGAPRVICSLWKVDDAATRALMVKFYSLWNPADGSKPLGTAAALRGAQEHVRAQEKWKHPYYWAAWVLWGLPD